ncbi:phosphorylase kinase alphabeta [Linderina pennispora]|uniref:Phosphorylase kinase alphabeta n=1 Tax=Linderina pennispora TaxID=61395 RepID=A0A1Y1W2Z3_9FUNG|nr:phosphorylase kinase alphabeta [Linderina pennispora]ORX67931.1 phosphorylase kinase alphabeta [Linderina pennispora]
MTKSRLEPAGTILSRQHPVTGLIPASVAITTHGNYQDAWVRDNVNSILAVYGLALAYRRVDDNQGRAYELEHAVVKLMRGLLFSMSRQSAKVEKFKYTHNPLDSLHAKYDTGTGSTVVEDNAWGHLQIDATSIFLLMLAQMTANGLQIVFTQDEVDFVQNLVFYIEQAYAFGEYGAWERGSKQNTGILELNSSSIGIVVGALRAIHGLNLFGARGGPKSVIHCFNDETTRCYQTLLSQLPRESNSKEIDGAILSAIGFPSFAVCDAKLCDKVYEEIVRKLRGRYGLKRFLKDGHQLHYEERELEIFKDVESEWPLFFTYIILGAQFTDKKEIADEYMAAIKPLLYDSRTHKPMCQDPSVSLDDVLHGDHFPLIPELFYVPLEAIEKEKANPRSQDREPNENLPLVWANSLFYLGRLIHEGLLEPAEFDPLNCRANAMRTDPTNSVVQVVLLSEDAALKEELAVHGLETQTPADCKPVRVLNCSSLVDVYSRLGQNEKLGLTGRPARPLGTLATSNLYRMQGQLYAFTPNFLNSSDFYLTADSDYLVSSITNELQFISANFTSSGRPTLVLPLTHAMFNAHNANESIGTRHRSLLSFIKDLRAGVVPGVRVRVTQMAEAVPTSHISSLDFLATARTNPLLDAHMAEERKGSRTPALQAADVPTTPTTPRMTRVSSRHGSMNALHTPIMHSDDSTHSYFNMANSLGQTTPRYKLQQHNVDVTDDFEVLGISTEDEEHDSLQIKTTRVPPATPPMLTLQIGDASQVLAAEEALAASTNLYDQAELLTYLSSCHGLDHRIHRLDATVRELLEEVYERAVASHLWNPVRTAAGLLRKRVPGLDMALAELTARRKIPSIGFGANEVFIKQPMGAAELAAMIDDKYSSEDEILKAMQELAMAAPNIFNGILFLRTHEMVIALREEISRLLSVDEAQAIEELFNSTPFQVKTLLHTVLSGPLLSSTNSFTMIEEDLATQVQAYGSDEEPLRADLPDLSQSSELTLEVQSGGLRAGNFSRIAINGNTIPVIDAVARSIVDLRNFNTSLSHTDSDKLAHFVDEAAQGDCAEKLTPAARHALESLGAAKVREIRARDSWCLIGHKYACRITVPAAKESLRRQSEGPTDILSVTLDLNQVAKPLTPDEQAVLASDSASLLVGPSFGRWLRRRKNDGTLNRVPQGFFPRVYELLRLSPGRGITVKQHTLDKDPLVFDKTPDEYNFALQVEKFLCTSIGDPAERQVMVTLLDVLYVIAAKAENSQQLRDVINVDLDMFDGVVNDPAKLDALQHRLFYDLPHIGRSGMVKYLAAAILANRSEGFIHDPKWVDECERLLSID